LAVSVKSAAHQALLVKVNHAVKSVALVDKTKIVVATLHHVVPQVSVLPSRAIVATTLATSGNCLVI
jgi:hypothetical protein